MYKPVLVATAALGMTLGIPAAASASPAQIVIHAVEHQQTFSQQGNAFSFESRLTQSGKVVGRDAVTCYLHGLCYGTFTFFREGSMFVQVPESHTQSKSFIATIVGGTQTFTNAHGGVTITGVSDSVSDLTFRFHT